MRKCNECKLEFTDHSGFRYCPFDGLKLKSNGVSTLFVVHCSEVFNRWSGDGYCQSVANYIQKFDIVIYLTTDLAPLPDCFGNNPNEQVWEFSWGYEPDSFDDDEKQFVIPSNGHEWTWIPKEIRTKPDLGKITVIGGAVNECLADWESVLDHLNYSYERNGNLVW